MHNHCREKASCLEEGLVCWGIFKGKPFLWKMDSHIDPLNLRLDVWCGGGFGGAKKCVVCTGVCK